MNKYKREPDVVVDLHGFTTKEAKEYLDELLDEPDFKYLRIITGKGTYKAGPVLRTYVEQYLQGKKFTFEYAKLYDGGEGVLEVKIGK